MLIWMRNMRKREITWPASPSAERVSSEYENQAAICRATPPTRNAGSTLVISVAALRNPGISGRSRK